MSELQKAQQKPSLSESIDYAIRSNAMEGLVTRQETLVMLQKIEHGEITFDDMRKAIDYKARSLAKGIRLNLLEAWEQVKGDPSYES